MPDDPVKLGEAIRAAREAKGLTREELAKRAGCSASNIYRMERGTAEKPRTLEKVLRVLGMVSSPAPETPIAPEPPRFAMLRLAVKSRKDHAFMDALMASVPPPGRENDPQWWFDRYAELDVAHAEVVEHPRSAPEPVHVDLLHANDPAGRARLAAAARGVSLSRLIELGWDPGRKAQTQKALTAVATDLNVDLAWLNTGEGPAIRDEHFVTFATRWPTFGARLQFARRMRGYTRASLSKKLHVGDDALATLEAGGHVADQMLPMRIAKLLKVDPEWLGVPERRVRARARG